MGRAHANPIMDTRLYQVEFKEGKVTELKANVIAESTYAQCDAKTIYSETLVDYHKDNKAISLTDQQITVQGRRVTKKTTAGQSICCQWKDSSTSWDKLSELKESHPEQTAKFAVAQGIDHEPAFNWLINHVLKKRDRIIASIRKRQTQYLKKSHKFGIELH